MYLEIYLKSVSSLLLVSFSIIILNLCLYEKVRM